ncbi:MAG: SagB family peptide dehydrogenase [Candidatus Heimdallarchaeota archaeon]
MNKKSIFFLLVLTIIVGLVIATPIILFNFKFKTSISLPSPDINGEVLLEDALLLVNQTPSFLPTEQLSLQTLSQLLWSMQGITHGQKRTTPSAGSLYPLELYIYTFNIENLPVALYQYTPRGHGINIIHEKNISKSYVNDSLLPVNKNLDQAQALIFISVVPERTTTKYGSRGIQYIQLEIGHVLGNLCLQSVTTKVHIEPIFHYNQTRVQEEFEIEEEIAVIIPIIKCASYESVVMSDLLQKDLFGNFTESNGLTVEQAIYIRQSIRNYQQQSIALSTLKRLFWYTFANKTRWLSSASKPITFTPVSAVHMFLVTSDRIENLEKGIYELSSEQFNITLFKLGDYVSDLYEAGLSQSSISTAASNVIFLLNTSLLQELLIEDPIPLGLYEIGMISQFLYLESRNLNLGMVVVGAFHDFQVTALIDDILSKPVYIIPIGVAELGDVNIRLLSFSKYSLSKAFGIITLVLFYISCFMASNPIKNKFKKNWLRAHHIFSSGFSLLFLLTHFILIIDVLPFFQSSQTGYAFLAMLKKIIGYKLAPFDSLYKVGLLTSIIAFWLIILMNILPYILFKIKKIPIKARRAIHQVFIGAILLCIYIHVYANCLSNPLQYWLFFTGNLGIILLFIGLHYHRPIISLLKKKSAENITIE